MTKPDIKKYINDQFAYLTKLGAEVINTEQRRAIKTGRNLVNCPDRIVVYSEAVYWIEIKLGKDTYSQGQWDMRIRLIQHKQTHMTLTEKNMDKLVEAIAGLHTITWCNTYFLPEQKHFQHLLKNKH